MSLRTIAYREFSSGDPRHWVLEKFELNDINLLVGKNATGKSRVVNVINVLCQIISGAHTSSLTAGEFTAEIELDERKYIYLITFGDNVVLNESLAVDGEMKLERNAQGVGSVYFESEKKSIPFNIDTGTIAIQTKNDRLQHPFIHRLSSWAAGTSLYNFGSDFGKNTLMQAVSMPPGVSTLTIPAPANDNTVGTYANAYQRFGEAFDKAVIRDMATLGYHLDEISAEPLPIVTSPLAGGVLMGLVTVERDLDKLRNPQMSMSQGMFRALALIIHLNLAISSHEKSLLLIDDIGEGLDFERAAAIIDLVITAAKNDGIQVVMTSNDRFVMNRIPLDYWAVLVRNKRYVKAFTHKNSQKQFEDFKFIGLSNFDFFKDSHFQVHSQK